MKPEIITVKHPKKYGLRASCYNLEKQGFASLGGCYKEGALFVQKMIK